MKFESLKKMVGQRIRLRPPATTYTFSREGQPVDVEWKVQAVHERPSRSVELYEPESGLIFTLGIDNMQDFRSSGHFMLKCQVNIRGNAITIEPLPDPRASTSSSESRLALSAEIDLNFQKRDISQDRHSYRLPVFVTNTGDTILSDWSIEVRFPQRLLEPRFSYPIVRTEGKSVVMRRIEADHSGPIFPGERKETLGIDYYMNHELYDKRGELFKEEIVATFYAGTVRVAQASRLVKDIQIF